MSKGKEGKCGLCGNEPTLLQDSHFLPKSVYKAMESLKKEGTPLVFRDNNSDAYPIARQLTHYFLCSDCEYHLNQGGENYFAEEGMHGKNLTPSEIMEIKKATGTQLTQDHLGPPEIIQQLVKCIRNISQQDRERQQFQASIFSNIDSQKLYYFAISIIWRGGHDVWKKYNSLTIEPELLQKMAEYLLGRHNQFPAVKVSIAPAIYKQAYSTVFPAKISNNVIYFSILFFDFYVQLGDIPQSLDEAVLYDFTTRTAERSYSIKKNVIEQSAKRGKAKNMNITW